MDNNEAIELETTIEELTAQLKKARRDCDRCDISDRMIPVLEEALEDAKMALGETC